jgi:hypothetical protein
MVKSVFVGWWFIIQLIFHTSFPQQSVQNELEKIQKFIVEQFSFCSKDFILEQFNLIPVVYLGDMACKY